MVRWLAILVRTLRSTIRTQRELALENLALRQQVAVWKVRQPRPQLTATDRLFWVVLSRLWKNWRSSLQVVRPETVVRWHRQGFRRYWAWKSRHRRGRPMIRTELRHLIRRLSRANPHHGASDRRVDGATTDRGVRAGGQPSVSDPGSGPGLWRTIFASGQDVGHPGDGHSATIAVAKCLCRARDWLDSTRMSGPYRGNR